MSTPKPIVTREAFLASARETILHRYANQPDADQEVLEHLNAVKVVYGVGAPNLRGICYFHGWHDHNGDTPLIEVTAFGEENRWQLAGTLLHELAHAAAGWKAGHGTDWRKWATRFGLRFPRAAGHIYMPAGFANDLRATLYRLNDPADGKPNLRAGLNGQWTPRKAPPCPVAIGVRGGRSRGKGSGSRLRLWTCECTHPPVRVRVASDDFRAHCDICHAAFKREGD